MATMNKNDATGHAEHWKLVPNAAGLYELPTAGKYVDRNIDVVVGKGAVAASLGTTTDKIDSLTVGAKSGDKYAVTAGKNLSAKVTTTITDGFLVAADGGETDVTLAAAVDATIDAGELKAESSNVKGEITSITIGATQTDNKYSVSGTGDVTGTTTASVKDAGYVTDETATADITGTASLKNVTIDAGVAAPSSTDLKATASVVTLGDKTTTQPTNGAYITVQGSGDVQIGKGYYGDDTATAYTSIPATVYYPINTNELTEEAIAYQTNADGTADGVDSVKVTVTVPAGYYEAGTTVEKTLTDLLPDLGTDATDAHILNGYMAYNDKGQKVVGTIGTITPQINTTIPTGAVSSGTIERGNAIKIPKGYVSADVYYTAQANTGNVVLSAQTDNNVDGYATASVVSAGNISIAPQATNSQVTVSQTVEATTGYYAVVNSITASGAHASAGWVGTETETGTAEIKVGEIAASVPTFTKAADDKATTIKAGTDIVIPVGYIDRQIKLTAELATDALDTYDGTVNFTAA